MPFTFSHPAIVLPLYRLWPRWFSLTGLVMGSIVPDFEYFIKLRVHSNISHTIPGLFLFDLPVALLLALLFHLVVRDPLIRHLPGYLQKRYGRYLHQSWLPYLRQNFWVVVGSVLLGAFSHQFWDSFTHRPEFFVQRIAFLREMAEVAGYQVEVYRIVQHTSTLIGAVVVGWFIHQLPAGNSASTGQPYWWYWPVVSMVAGLLFLVRIVLPQQFGSIGNIGVTLIAGVLLGIVVASAAVNKRAQAAG